MDNPAGSSNGHSVRETDFSLDELFGFTSPAVTAASPESTSASNEPPTSADFLGELDQLSLMSRPVSNPSSTTSANSVAFDSFSSPAANFVADSPSSSQDSASVDVGHAVSRVSKLLSQALAASRRHARQLLNKNRAESVAQESFNKIWAFREENAVYKGVCGDGQQVQYVMPVRKAVIDAEVLSATSRALNDVSSLDAGKVFETLFDQEASELRLRHEVFRATAANELSSEQRVVLLKEFFDAFCDALKRGSSKQEGAVVAAHTIKVMRELAVDIGSALWRMAPPIAADADADSSPFAAPHVDSCLVDLSIAQDLNLGQRVSGLEDLSNFFVVRLAELPAGCEWGVALLQPTADDVLHQNFVSRVIGQAARSGISGASGIPASLAQIPWRKLSRHPKVADFAPGQLLESLSTALRDCVRAAAQTVTVTSQAARASASSPVDLSIPQEFVAAILAIGKCIVMIANMCPNRAVVGKCFRAIHAECDMPGKILLMPLVPMLPLGAFGDPTLDSNDSFSAVFCSLFLIGSLDSSLSETQRQLEEWVAGRPAAGNLDPRNAHRDRLAAYMISNETVVGQALQCDPNLRSDQHFPLLACIRGICDHIISRSVASAPDSWLPGIVAKELFYFAFLTRAERVGSRDNLQRLQREASAHLASLCRSEPSILSSVVDMIGRHVPELEHDAVIFFLTSGLGECDRGSQGRHEDSPFAHWVPDVASLTWLSNMLAHRPLRRAPANSGSEDADIWLQQYLFGKPEFTFPPEVNAKALRIGCKIFECIRWDRLDELCPRSSALSSQATRLVALCILLASPACGLSEEWLWQALASPFIGQQLLSLTRSANGGGDTSHHLAHKFLSVQAHQLPVLMARALCALGLFESMCAGYSANATATELRPGGAGFDRSTGNTSSPVAWLTKVGFFDCLVAIVKATKSSQNGQQSPALPRKALEDLLTRCGRSLAEPSVALHAGRLLSPALCAVIVNHNSVGIAAIRTGISHSLNLQSRQLSEKDGLGFWSSALAESLASDGSVSMAGAASSQSAMLVAGISQLLDNLAHSCICAAGTDFRGRLFALRQALSRRNFTPRCILKFHPRYPWLACSALSAHQPASFAASTDVRETDQNASRIWLARELGVQTKDAKALLFWEQFFQCFFEAEAGHRKSHVLAQADRDALNSHFTQMAQAYAGQPQLKKLYQTFYAFTTWSVEVVFEDTVGATAVAVAAFLEESDRTALPRLFVAEEDIDPEISRLRPGDIPLISLLRDLEPPPFDAFRSQNRGAASPLHPSHAHPPSHCTLSQPDDALEALLILQSGRVKPPSMPTGEDLIEQFVSDLLLSVRTEQVTTMVSDLRTLGADYEGRINSMRATDSLFLQLARHLFSNIPQHTSAAIPCQLGHRCSRPLKIDVQGNVISQTPAALKTELTDNRSQYAREFEALFRTARRFAQTFIMLEVATQRLESSEHDNDLATLFFALLPVVVTPNSLVVRHVRHSFARLCANIGRKAIQDNSSRQVILLRAILDAVDSVPSAVRAGLLEDDPALEEMVNCFNPGVCLASETQSQRGDYMKSLTALLSFQTDHGSGDKWIASTLRQLAVRFKPTRNISTVVKHCSAIQLEALFQLLHEMLAHGSDAFSEIASAIVNSLIEFEFPKYLEPVVNTLFLALASTSSRVVSQQTYEESATGSLEAALSAALERGDTAAVTSILERPQNPSARAAAPATVDEAALQAALDAGDEAAAEAILSNAAPPTSEIRGVRQLAVASEIDIEEKLVMWASCCQSIRFGDLGVDAANQLLVLLSERVAAVSDSTDDAVREVTLAASLMFVRRLMLDTTSLLRRLSDENRPDMLRAGLESSHNGILPDVPEISGQATIWGAFETFSLRCAQCSLKSLLLRSSTGSISSADRYWDDVCRLITDVVLFGCPTLVNRVFYSFRQISDFVVDCISTAEALVSSDEVRSFNYADFVARIATPLRRMVFALPWDDKTECFFYLFDCDAPRQLCKYFTNLDPLCAAEIAIRCDWSTAFVSARTSSDLLTESQVSARTASDVSLRVLYLAKLALWMSLIDISGCRDASAALAGQDAGALLMASLSSLPESAVSWKTLPWQNFQVVFDPECIRGIFSSRHMALMDSSDPSSAVVRAISLLHSFVHYLRSIVPGAVSDTIVVSFARATSSVLFFSVATTKRVWHLGLSEHKAVLTTAIFPWLADDSLSESALSQLLILVFQALEHASLRSWPLPSMVCSLRFGTTAENADGEGGSSAQAKFEEFSRLVHTLITQACRTLRPAGALEALNIASSAISSMPVLVHDVLESAVLSLLSQYDSPISDEDDVDGNTAQSLFVAVDAAAAALQLPFETSWQDVATLCVQTGSSLALLVVLNQQRHRNSSADPVAWWQNANEWLRFISQIDVQRVGSSGLDILGVWAFSLSVLSDERVSYVASKLSSARKAVTEVESALAKQMLDQTKRPGKRASKSELPMQHASLSLLSHACMIFLKRIQASRSIDSAGSVALSKHVDQVLALRGTAEYAQVVDFFQDIEGLASPLFTLDDFIHHAAQKLAPMFPHLLRI